MHAPISHLIADITTLPWIAIICIVGGFLITIVVIVGGLLFANRRQQQWHETARLALEKGQPLPPLPDAQEESAPSSAKGPAADIRSGLILIAVGVGLYVFLNALVSRALGLVGAIPGLIGVALLLFGLVSAFKQPRNPPAP